MSDRPRIGVLLSRVDPYWVQVNESVNMRGQQIPVAIIPIEAEDGYGEKPIAEQDKLAEDILALGLSALITIYLHPYALERILNAGLPVVHLTEVEYEHPKLVPFEGHYASAYMAGEFVVKRLHGKGHVIVVGGYWEQVNDNRVRAFTDITRQYPMVTWQHIPAPWAYDQAYPVIENALLTVRQPIDAVIGISDSLALAASHAGRSLGAVGDQTIIIGINGDPLALAAVTDGTLTATVETDSTGLGRDAVDVAFARSMDQPTRSTLSIRSTLVTAENVADLALKKLIEIANIPTRLVGTNREAEQSRIRQLEMVTSINQQIGGLLDRNELLQKVVELIQRHYHYKQVYVYRWHHPGQTLYREYPPRSPDEECSIPVEQAGLVGEVTQKGDPIFIPDVLHSLHYAPDTFYPQTRARAILPIRHNGEIVGVLDLHSSRQMQHLRQEMLSLQLLVDQLGIATQNATLYEKAVIAQTVAERADQLKTRLLANVSHELRTPINVILGFSQMVLKEPNPYDLNIPEKMRRDIGHIFQSGEHLTRLINDLLDMSRLDIGALELFPEMIDPYSYLDSVFKSISENAQRDHVVWYLDLPESLPVIQADPVRLRQILLNLLSNAIKFTKEGQITLGAEAEPPHLHIWVHDTGAGILPQEQARIFEPFVSLSSQRQLGEGIGLGLSITRHLVALHNGILTLDSQMGAGSTFHIYLPLPGLSGGQVPALTPSTESTLLLISHQPKHSHAILQLCQRRKLSIQRITTTGEAEAFLRSRQPAALAWDMIDAHPDDWDLIAQLRRHPMICRLPFLLYNQQAGAAGMTNVLIKPVSHATLVDIFETYCPKGKQHPILIVDDDEKVREMYMSVLSETMPGVSVQCVSDGQYALEALESITPSLVILDLVMPRVDGFAVLEFMRKTSRLQMVPVVVMSGKLLTIEDVRRLDYARVIFQSKDTLSSDETLKVWESAMFNSNRLPQPTSLLVKQALAYMHQNYAQQITRQDIAAAVGVNERYLTEIFGQEMSISLWDALNRFRIQRACDLLRSTGNSITAIASQVGFSDSSYFGRVFKIHLGMSPVEYRKG
jgi:signal transduction histidine kinase/ABC-type sugar transport system substrate-binding protein/AraC-like DNA-binding protein